jgi:hypothetical protein
MGRTDARTGPARSADLGRAAAATAFDAAATAARACCRTTRRAAGSGQLGRHCGAARAGLGRSSSGSA